MVVGSAYLQLELVEHSTLLTDLVVEAIAATISRRSIERLSMYAYIS